MLAKIHDCLGELLAPTRCSACDAYGLLLCQKCRTLIQMYAPYQACKRCAAPYGELICTECVDTDFAFSAAVVLGTFESGLGRSIVIYKDANERRLGRYLGILLGARIRIEFGEWGDVATWLPPHPKALRRRGFDHGMELAQSVAASSGLCAHPLLSRHSFADMRSLNREDRLRAVSHAFQTTDTLKGLRVLLVDDVITTGASANAGAQALIEAGAAEVRVAAIARTW